MAKIYFGSDKGQNKDDIVSGAAVLNKGIEIVIDQAQGMSKADIITKLEELEQAILESKSL
jgi:hypothetical protein